MTKEKALISLLYHIAKADGTVSQEEIDAMADIASRMKDFDTEEIKNAMKEKTFETDIKSITSAVDINDRIKVLFGCCYVIAADNIVKVEEMFKLHEIALLMDIPGAIITYNMAKVIAEYPNIQFEDGRD